MRKLKVNPMRVSARSGSPLKLGYSKFESHLSRYLFFVFRRSFPPDTRGGGGRSPIRALSVFNAVFLSSSVSGAPSVFPCLDRRTVCLSGINHPEWSILCAARFVDRTLPPVRNAGKCGVMSFRIDCACRFGVG